MFVNFKFVLKYYRVLKQIMKKIIFLSKSLLNTFYFFILENGFQTHLIFVFLSSFPWGIIHEPSQPESYKEIVLVRKSTGTVKVRPISGPAGVFPPGFHS